MSHEPVTILLNFFRADQRIQFGRSASDRPSNGPAFPPKGPIDQMVKKRVHHSSKGPSMANKGLSTSIARSAL